MNGILSWQVLNLIYFVKLDMISSLLICFSRLFVKAAQDWFLGLPEFAWILSYVKYVYSYIYLQMK